MRALIRCLDRLAAIIYMLSPKTTPGIAFMQDQNVVEMLGYGWLLNQKYWNGPTVKGEPFMMRLKFRT